MRPYDQYRRPYFVRPRGGASCNCHKCRSKTSPFRLGSWLDGSRASAPTKEDVNKLLDKKASPAEPCLGLTDQEAYGLAHEALENYRRTRVVCLAPEKRALYERKHLPRMVFDQLDKELFRSVLKGNILLQAVSGRELPPGIYAMTTKADSRRNSRITITLSKDLLIQETRASILVTLIHQMIHAYYLQCCGYRNKEGDASGHDLKHGLEFEALLSLISEHCSIANYPRNINLRKLQSPLEAWLAAHPARLGPHTPDPKVDAGNSNCYCHQWRSNPILEIDCKNWRNKALAITRSLEESRKNPPIVKNFETLNIRPSVRFEVPKADLYHFIDPQTSKSLEPLPRSQFLHPPETYIELHFESLVFPVFRSHIASHLPELTKSPCFTSNRILTLPKTSSKDDLITLLEFLQLSPSSILRENPVSPQLPLIGPYDPSSKSILRSHISAYHLAQTLTFRSLAIHALSLLHRTPSTQEDSIAVLEFIYHPPSPLPSDPDPPLRTWTKSWLQRDRRGFDHGWGDYAAGYLTNLNVLRSHPDWRKKYASLREKGTVLITDLDAVEQIVGGWKTKLYGPAYDQYIPPVPTENRNRQPLPRSFSYVDPPTPQEYPGWPYLWGQQQPTQAAEQA